MRIQKDIIKFLLSKSHLSFILKVIGFILLKKLKIIEANYFLRKYSYCHPQKTGDLFLKAATILHNHREHDSALGIWLLNKDLVYNNCSTVFIEKIKNEIPSQKINNPNDISFINNELKLYTQDPVDNTLLNNQIDDFDGLLAYDRKELEKNPQFKMQLYLNNHENKQILKIPNTIIAGINTPSSLSGYTPVSLDGYWIESFTQGNIDKSIFHYQTSKINKNKYTQRHDQIFVAPGWGLMNRYYHALCNTFPTLKRYKDLNLNCPIIFPSFPLDIQPAIQNIQSIVLDSLNIPEKKVLTINNLSNSVFDIGILPAHYKVDGFLFDFYQQLTSKLENKVQINNDKKYLYISRRSATRRTIINENEVIDLLESKGFTIIEMEKINFHGTILSNEKCFNNNITSWCRTYKYAFL